MDQLIIVLVLFLAVPLAGFAIFLAQYAARHRNPRVHRNKCLLYLRPFSRDEDESHPVSIGILNNVISVGLGVPITIVEPDSLEKVVATEMEKVGHKLVAIHNPRNLLRRGGATKINPDGDDWRATVRTLAESAICVLIQAGPSEGIQWELEFVRDHIDPQQVFVLIGFDSEKEGVNWALSRSALAKARMEVPEDFPGAGTVLSFDRHYRAELVARNCSNAKYLVDAIARRIPSVKASSETAHQVDEIILNRPPSKSPRRSTPDRSTPYY